MFKPLLTIATLVLSTAASTMASAAVWHCTNKDMEIGCSETSCKALVQQGDFTPMSINFTDDGYIYACMYSGCWEGQGEVFKSKDFLSVHGHNLTYSTDPNTGEIRANVAVTVDFEDNVAVMKVGGYAQPLICRMSD